MKSTTPAPAEDSFPTAIPRLAQVSRLALAALEAGVTPADVLAHLASRGGTPTDEIARLTVELLAVRA